MTSRRKISKEIGKIFVCRKWSRWRGPAEQQSIDSGETKLLVVTSMFLSDFLGCCLGSWTFLVVAVYLLLLPSYHLMAALHGVVARKKPSKKMTKRNQSAIRSVMRKLRNMQYQTQQKNLLNTTETNKLYSEIEEEILLLLLSFTPIPPPQLNQEKSSFFVSIVKIDYTEVKPFLSAQIFFHSSVCIRVGV